MTNLEVKTRQFQGEWLVWIEDENGRRITGHLSSTHDFAISDIKREHHLKKVRVLYPHGYRLYYQGSVL